MGGVSRRDFLGTGALAAGALAFGPSFWREALAAPATPGPGPYGALGPPDPATGIAVPQGFSVREIARANQAVPGTAYPWHVFSDGQATYATTDGGWVLVSNSESLAFTGAGSSAIRFGPDGAIVDAYRILAGTNGNCAGGRTPWGTWLSCEEYDKGQVWEANPLGTAAEARPRPALGFFNHEAAAVDPVGKHVYMTEDERDGCFYRFTPSAYPSLESGTLAVAVGAVGGEIEWVAVPDPSAIDTATRQQVPGAARFGGGEGIWYDAGVVYFSTKGENRIYSYDTDSAVLEVRFDGNANPTAELTGLDNLCVSRSGDLFVCEDNKGAEFSVGIVSREGEVARFATASGSIHAGSEFAGVIFDPSGGRMYVASQRAHEYGAIYEITGPFRVDPPPGAEPPDTGEPPPLDPGPGPGDQGDGDGSESDGGSGSGDGSGADGSGGSTSGGDTSGGDAGGGSTGGGSAGSTSAPSAEGATSRSGGLRASAARTVSGRTLLRSGVAVNVQIAGPGAVTVALRSADLERVAGARGSTDRPKTVTLARVRKRFGRPGRYKVRLKLPASKRRYLERAGSIDARFTVQVRPDSGPTDVVSRSVRLMGMRARR